MVNTRFFSGARDRSDEKSIAAQIMRLEFEKKGKLEPTERFKMIMKLKMDAAKKQYNEQKAAGRPMSARAEKALKDMAAKKAAKQAKKMRQMVIVQPQKYHNGQLNRKGKVFDIAGNVVAKVNTKNGKMSTMMGLGLGKYKPKSQYVNLVLTNAINQYSPYYINLRKLQAMQAAGINPVTGQPLNQSTINVHGNSNMAMHGGGYVPPSAYDGGGGNAPSASFENSYGEAATGPRQNIGATAWGAMSDNVWGTFADNAWGTSADTVWGTNMSDVWGGIGGNPYGAGAKTVQVWGTGSGKNYIKAATNAIRKLFGSPTKENIKALNAFRQSRSASPARVGSVTRTATEHAPVRSSTPAPRSGK